MIIQPFRRRLIYPGPTIIPGGISFTAPGTYSFVVPFYHTLTADVRGAGGGGGGWRWTDTTIYMGGNGTSSYFAAPDATLIGNGGGGGQGRNRLAQGGAAGSPGSASGGNLVNDTGQGSPGGQGAIGHVFAGAPYAAGPGGNGGRAVRNWTRSQWGVLVPRSIITVVVGTGGTAGTVEPFNVDQNSEPGANGAVYISWS